RDDPFAVNLQIAGANPNPADVRFSGTPEQSAVGLAATDLKWLEATVKLGGGANVGETWTLQIDLNGDGTPDAHVDYHVLSDGRALSKIVRDWADALNSYNF